MLFVQRVWRNGSVLSEQIVCAECKAELEENWWGYRLHVCDEQTFTPLESPSDTAACECDDHLYNTTGIED